MSTTATLQPQRMIDELKELRALTGTADGAQRVCWTETWAKGRAWMREKLAQLPVEVEVDQAGNLWATLRGAVRARAAASAGIWTRCRTAAGSTAA